MELTWHGNTCFKFKSKKGVLIINPDKEAGELSGDIVLSSLKSEPAKVQGAYKIFSWPGEYEARDINITALQAWTKSKTNEEKSGGGEETMIFAFDVEGIKCCHLGELGHSLTSDMVNKIGDVDILMINAGKGSNLGKEKATEIIEAIEPRALILMGSDVSDDILKSLGADKIEPMDKFSIKSLSELPEDKRVYIYLKEAEKFAVSSRS